MRTHAMGVLTCAVIASLSACGQPQEPPRTPNENLAQKPDTPRTDIRVNKEYDEHGNLISFDSSYTSYHGAMTPEAMDSLFQSLLPGVGMSPYRVMDNRPGPFVGDTLFQHFFQDDFFKRSMEMHQRMWQRLMPDSLPSRTRSSGMVQMQAPGPALSRHEGHRRSHRKGLRAAAGTDPRAGEGHGGTSA